MPMGLRDGRKRRMALEQATDWFLRIRDNKLTQAEYARWRKWLTSDSRYAQAFDDITRTWNQCDGLRGSQWPDPVVTASVGDRRQGRASRLARFHQQLAAFGRAIPRPALALGLVAAAVLVTLVARDPWPGPTREFAPQVYRTAIAENRVIELKDGSTITLGANSNVSVAFSPTDRSLILHHGEALFHVAKDKDRPFVVTAGARTVKAIGTTFNVNIGAGGVTVTVVEGTVQISPRTGKPLARAAEGGSDPAPDTSAAPPIILTGGHAIDYGAGKRPPDIKTADLDTATSWRLGRMTFRSAPLSSVIADVNRYTPRNIVIVDRPVGDMKFTGTVFLGEINDWLAGLDKGFPIRIIEFGDDVTLVINRGGEKSDG